VLKNADILPPFFNYIPLSQGFSKINPNLIFITVAVLLSIIIEGINQTGFETNLNLEKEIEKNNNKQKKWLLNIYKRCTKAFWGYVIIKPTILQTSKHFFEYMKYENPLCKFITDSGITITSYRDYYNALNMCAKVVDCKGRKNDVHRFRDLSYLMQMVRMSFFLIMPIAFFVGIFGICKLENADSICSLITFVVISILISLAFILTIPMMSCSFGKRYIRDVGGYYDALNFQFDKEKAEA